MEAARPEHAEITPAHRPGGDCMAVRPTHAEGVGRRLRAGGYIEEPPELGWSWSSPKPVGDLVLTVDGIRLVSPRMREVFDAHLGPADEIQWLPATVTLADGTRSPSWVPHFPVHHNLLDREHSTFGPSGLPILYVLSRSKLAGHAVTVLPNHPLSTIVSTTVVDALTAIDAIGVDVMCLSTGP